MFAGDIVVAMSVVGVVGVGVVGAVNLHLVSTLAPRVLLRTSSNPTKMFIVDGQRVLFHIGVVPNFLGRFRALRNFRP